jgi:ABC-2 type transport system ATP-binding protein
VTARSLAKRYGSHEALHGIDLDIPRGSVFGMIGPNGAGKTTTMRLLLDIIRPSGGELRVLGESPRDGGASLRRRIGYLPGELHLASRVRGRELLAHYAQISGSVRRGAVEELADRLGVDLGRPVRSLSKGNKQKIGLIQAFMHEPELLVLDEPTVGLDPVLRRDLWGLFHRIADGGAAVLVSSHVMDEAERCDRLLLMRDGVFIADDTPDAIRARTGVDDIEQAFLALVDQAGAA